MKRIFTLSALCLFISVGVFAQSSTNAPQLTISDLSNGSLIGWVTPTPAELLATDFVYTSTSTTFVANGDYTGFLFTKDYGFAIPAASTINSILVRITRKARGAGINDNTVQLVKAGAFVGVNDADLNTAWTAVNKNIVYDGDQGNGFNPLWGTTWTPAEINAPGFGVVITAFKQAGANSGADFADIDRVSIQVFYTLVTPIILTNFDVKNVNNKVNISFTTEAEYKVKTMYIERSSDGKNYTDLFAIEPKGGLEISHTYQLTDAAPLLGTNYYRLKEIDIDGKWHYYETRVVKVNSVSNKFQAYMNSGNVVVNVSNIPGNYTISMIDLNGAVLSSKNFKIDKQSLQLSMDPPVKRTGVYLINMRGGEGVNETIKIFIQK